MDMKNKRRMEMKNKLFLTMLCAIGLCLIMACQSNGEEVIGKDFSLKVTVDKTRAKVGDTVTATVVFKNLSGEEIEAELPGWIAELGGQNTEDILLAHFTKVEEALVVFILPDILFEPLPKILIESGAVIERKFRHVIKESGKLCVIAGAFFITTDTTAPRFARISCESKTIKVR